MKYPRFIILTAIFGTIIIGSVFTFPKYKEYLKVAQKLVNQKTFLENQAQYYREIEETFRKLETKREIVDKIASILPKKLDSASLINYFNTVSQKHGLLLQDILITSGGSFPKIERIQSHQITLKLLGTYSSFKDFLVSLEKNARLFEVDQVTFSAPEEKDIYDFEVQLTVYSY